MKNPKAVLGVGISVILSIVMGVQSVAGAVTSATEYVFSNTPDIFMTELQTRSVSDARQEFIELYNNTDQTVDFSNGERWELQYFTGSSVANLLAHETANGWNTTPGISPYKTIPLTARLLSGEHYLLSASGYELTGVTPHATFAPWGSSGMSSSEGALQLVSTDGTRTVVHDRLVWSLEMSSQQAGAIAPHSSGGTLQRTLTAADTYSDEDDQLAPWASAEPSTPTTSWIRPEAPIEPEDPPTDDDTTSPTDPPQPLDATDPPLPNQDLDEPFITELLPNPSSDESDEFIELYNPNSEPFNLKGYELQTGITTVHSFVITSDTRIPAEGYLALGYNETKLALSNSGGRARLLNSSKLVVSETDVYGTAKEAQSWARTVSGAWQWSDTTTRGEANIVTSTPPLLALVNKSSGKVKGVSTKKTTLKAPKVPKSTKTKTKAKKLKKTTPQLATGLPSAAEKSPVLHPVALATVAIAALAYVAYEYRKDLANFFSKFSRH